MEKSFFDFGVDFGNIEESYKALVGEKTTQEVSNMFNDVINDIKTRLAEINEVDKLDNLEKELGEIMDKYDAYIRSRVYTLPKSCTFEGKNYSHKEVGSKIVYFMNKETQTWQYVLGLYELYKFWITDSNETVSYGQLDTTLHLMGKAKATGSAEWKDMLIINSYINTLDNQFTKDLTLVYALGHAHNEIMSRRELVLKVGTQERKD